MEVLNRTCMCGLDVHKKSITACVVTSQGKEIKTFKSPHAISDRDLIDWMKEHGCTHVAMESTGVYWKPIVNLLRGRGYHLLRCECCTYEGVFGGKPT